MISKYEAYPGCPQEAWDCPYFDENTYRCMMFKELNCLPYDECDAFWESEEEE